MFSICCRKREEVAQYETRCRHLSNTILVIGSRRCSLFLLVIRQRSLSLNESSCLTGSFVSERLICHTFPRVYSASINALMQLLWFGASCLLWVWQELVLALWYNLPFRSVDRFVAARNTSIRRRSYSNHPDISMPRYLTFARQCSREVLSIDQSIESVYEFAKQRVYSLGTTR